MKKLISIVLSTVLCAGLMLGVLPTVASANDISERYLKFTVNQETKFYKCLWDNENIYCSVPNLAEISNYDWAKIDNRDCYEFYKEYESDSDIPVEQIKTNVTVEIENKNNANIKTMNNFYSVYYYMKDDELYLPLEKLLYLLHAKWQINNDSVTVVPMPLTILDFLAIHRMDLKDISSVSEDVLIDTGWLFSDSKWGQAVYSSLAEVFNDFDGKIFMLWLPGEGHPETAEGYEKAVLQLAKEDKEFIGKKVQTDAIHLIADSAFLYNEYASEIQNVMSLPENINKIVQDIPDAVSLLNDLGVNNDKWKDISKKIENGEIDTSFLENPQLKSKTQQLQDINDGLSILQCVWNAYDTATRVYGWDDEYLSQLQILSDYETPSYVNKNVSKYISSTAKRLIDSYNHPIKAAYKEALKSTFGLLASKVFDESPFGSVFSIMGAVGSCYGSFDVEFAEVYNVYSELSMVSYSIKIEQLVRLLVTDNDLLCTTEKLTNDRINTFRNQLMMYLRLNLRNKAQLYNLNIRGNKDKNWVNSEKGKELYEEIVEVYAMLAELITTKDYDSLIILDEDLDSIPSGNNNYKKIPEDLLVDELKKDISHFTGEWEIDSKMTMDRNGVSMTYLFGTAYKYGNHMEIGKDQSFSYTIGAGNGGEGSWNYKSGIFSYSINAWEGDIEQGNLVCDDSSGEIRLVMDYFEYKIYWMPQSNAFASFLQNNYIGAYYAIINAGENQEPILIVTEYFNENDTDTYVPETGYMIAIFKEKNGNVYQIGDYAALSQSAGPWYFYNNKLLCLSRRRGYYTTDIQGDSYTQNIHEDDDEVYSNWEVIKLTKNRGADNSDAINEKYALESEELYHLYADLVVCSEAQYGRAGLVSPVDGVNMYTGVCFIKLVDFDKDGIKEVLLVHHEPDSSSILGDYTFEIWDLVEGMLKKVDSGELFGTNGGTKTLCLIEYNDQYYIMNGYADESELCYYHGYGDSGYGIVYESSFHLDSDNGIAHYTLNGEEVSKDQWSKAKNEWEKGAQYYYMNQHASIEAMQICNKTKEELQFHSSDIVILTEDNVTDYILPASDTSSVNWTQIIVLDYNRLKLARNEIFARHGRRFDTPEIQEYFNSKSWYTPLYNPEEFDAIMYDVLSEVELDNIDIIKRLEDEIIQSGINHGE